MTPKMIREILVTVLLEVQKDCGCVPPVINDATRPLEDLEPLDSILAVDILCTVAIRAGADLSTPNPLLMKKDGLFFNIAEIVASLAAAWGSEEAAHADA